MYGFGVSGGELQGDYPYVGLVRGLRFRVQGVGVGGRESMLGLCMTSSEN